MSFALNVRNVLYRKERQATTIRDILSAKILREFEFPGCIVTITEIELTEKRDAAAVLVSVLPDERGPEVVRTLEHARGMLRHHLMKQLRIKVIPELFFRIDKGPQNAAAVETAMLQHELHEEGEDR